MALSELQFGSRDFPYATKIVVQELMGMNLIPKMTLGKNGIHSLNFSTFTPEEWEKYCSGRKITKPVTKGTTDFFETVEDPRQGTIREKIHCPTCGEVGLRCQNHFMYIPLKFPVYNKLFTKQILLFLNCVCENCGNCRKKRSHLDSKLLGIPKKQKLLKAKNIMQNIETCEECNEKVRLFYTKRTDKIFKIYSLNENEEEEEIDTEKLYEILKKVKNGAVDSLGFSSRNFDEKILSTNIKPDPGFFRPESMIFVNFPVVPICCRPWIETNGTKNNDDLTEMYNQLVKLNIKLSLPVSTKTKKTVAQLREELQFVANSIITTKDIPENKITKKKKGLSDRLNGKDGHVISNLTGKRGNFTARMVITTGGIEIPYGFIGIPNKKADLLYKKEVVTSWNLQRCKELVETGKVKYLERENITRRADFLPKGFGLNNGDVIYRQIQDGDLIPINRQPSIRSESFQAMRVRRIDHYAMRLPPPTTRGYNADYDGDEMNASVPQSSLAKAEMLVSMHTSKQIVTAQSSSALLSCIQNLITFFYYITNNFSDGKKYKIPSGLFMDCFSKELFGDFTEFKSRVKKYYPFKKFPKLLDGKIVASSIFPKDFFWEITTGVNKEFPKVIIHDGIVQPDSGPICKKTIGQGSTAIQYIWKHYSPSEAQRVINRASVLSYNLLRTLGFSVGISDSLLKGRELLEKTIREAFFAVEHLQKQERDPDLLEIKICEKLNNAMSVVPVLASDHLQKGDRNSYTVMKVSGTKGNDSNTGMMAAFLAQQNIDGKRPFPILTGGKRTLVHVEPGDFSPVTRGFATHSFLEGLTLKESLLQAHAGRRGVIDTASKTSSSGYSQKKIGKKIEDCVIEIDKSVRNFEENIYTFLYGDDGMNAKELIRVQGLDFPFFFDPINEAKRLSQGLKTKPFPKLIIDQLCDYIKVASPDFSSPVTRMADKNYSQVLRTLLSKTEIAPEKIDEFGRIFITQFHKSQCAHGSTVGMISCLSVGEIVIQLTMDTHRNVGGSAVDVTSGLPRLKECIEVTKNPSKKNMRFEMDIKMTKEESFTFSNKIKETLFRDVIFSSKIYQTREISDSEKPFVDKMYNRKIPLLKKWWVQKYKELVEKVPEFDCPWCILYSVDLSAIYTRKLTLKDLADKINENSYDSEFQAYSAYAVPSPLIEGKIVVYFNTELILKRISKRKTSIPKFITLENRPYYIVTRGCDDFVKDVLVSGIEGIKKVHVDYKGESPIFTTQGSNLQKIIQYPVKVNTLTSNDFWEMAEFYGFYVGKSSLFSEVDKAISSSGNSSLNKRHLQVLIDSMCRSGTFTSANRHGIKDNGIISQILFETPVEIVKTSCMYGERDEMKSISSSIFSGKRAEIGNGVVEVL